MVDINNIVKVEINRAKEVHGFVAEQQPITGFWLSHVATLDCETNKVRCHDLSGFLGSWDARGGWFFPSETGENICKVAMKKCADYCKEMNID